MFRSRNSASLSSAMWSSDSSVNSAARRELLKRLKCALLPRNVVLEYFDARLVGGDCRAQPTQPRCDGSIKGGLHRADRRGDVLQAVAVVHDGIDCAQHGGEFVGFQ